MRFQNQHCYSFHTKLLLFYFTLPNLTLHEPKISFSPIKSGCTMTVTFPSDSWCQNYMTKWVHLSLYVVWFRSYGNWRFLPLAWTSIQDDRQMNPMGHSLILATRQIIN